MRDMTLYMGTKKMFVQIAKEKALKDFHGYLENSESNLQEIIELFPNWNIQNADKSWCAAFVFYCLRKSGFFIPYSPKECITCSLAGCGGFEEFAIEDKRISYIKDRNKVQVGDIVLYDNVFCNKEHDHMGIIIEIENDYIICAEGNVPNTNSSGIVKRKIDDHIRAYIRIPDGYSYYN